MGPGVRRGDRGKVVADGIIKLYYRRSLSMTLRLDRMTIFSRERPQEIHPRHRRPAGPSRLRAGVVHLSGQPFREPRARQYFDGCPCHRRLLPHRVLANFSRSRWCFILPPWSTPGLGIWALYERRQFRWKAIEPAAARARLEHSGAHHRPHCRRAGSAILFLSTKSSIRRCSMPT